MREGTGQGMKNFLPPEVAVAGKTGTTDEQRDAWFAGFTGDRLAIVWVGYDDNRAARLSGSAAALPVWGDLMGALTPEPLAPQKPERIELVWIDPQSGLRGGTSCPGSRWARGACAVAIGHPVCPLARRFSRRVRQDQR